MSRTARISILTAAALVLAGAVYLWSTRGAAIMLDYVITLCM